MIGNVIAWIFIAVITIGWIIDLRHEARKRSTLTPEQRRMQRLYAQMRKRRWQPHAKRPSGAWAGRPRKTPRFDPTQQKLL